MLYFNTKSCRGNEKSKFYESLGSSELNGFCLIYYVWLCLLIFFIPGCVSFQQLQITPLEHTPVYDALFPCYVEVATLSRIHPKAGDRGTKAGHAVMFLRGVCIDDTAKFPLLKMCSETKGCAYGDNGVGISVKKMFKNVNWIAVPKRDLFYHGGLKPEEFLSADRVRQAVQKAVHLRIFRGVKIHEAYLGDKPNDEQMEEYIAKKSIGTDYAISFGDQPCGLKYRSPGIFCTKLFPI